MIKKYSMLVAMAIVAMSTHAQNQTDALRYSQTILGGTARYVSMGGAFGALGADASTLSFNPAGIALYRKSELTFTPIVYNGKTRSDFGNNVNIDNKLNLHFGNAAFIIHIPKDYMGWKGVTLGVAYNRQNNFYNRSYIEGEGDGISLLNQFSNEAKGVNPNSLDPFGADLAYQTYLIDTIPGAFNEYFANTNLSKLTQTKSIENSGYMSETALSFGANYNNKLYIGATLGFNKLKYEETSRYQENDNDTAKTKPNQPIKYGMDLNKFVLNEQFNTTGKGINFKVGAVYSIFDWLRVGAGIHTPVYFYNMNDIYSDSITAFYSYFETPSSTLKNGSIKTYSSPEGYFDYSFTSPFRYNFSIGIIVNKSGLISADFEHVNYNQAKLNAKNDDFRAANNSIKSNYNSADNLRIGTEWRIEPFSIRGGFAYYASPYNNKINDGRRLCYSLGLGYKMKIFYMDVAYQIVQSKEKYYLFDSAMQASINSLTRNSFLTTVGFKF